MKNLSIFLSVCLLLSCEPLVDKFDDIENAIYYTSKSKTTAPAQVQTITVMTYNIRFGAGRAEWFGDSCGDRVILSKAEITSNLEKIASKINEYQPDIIFLQEVDVESKRSGYIDEVQWLLDRTHFNYGVFASNWKVQFIPSDGLGRMNMGNAILSRWEITNAIRVKLPLRDDQNALTQYFYLRRNIIKAKIDIPGVDNFYAVNVHTAAFSTDDTKKKHINQFKAELEYIDTAGDYFVAGGDLNTLPPGAAKTDYCLENKCPGESFHGPNDNPQHKEGSYYTPEATWLIPFYNEYEPAVTLENYLANEAHYFSQTELFNEPYDKKLDYLFTNFQWVAGSDSTHQNMSPFSDHAPVSARWEVPK